MIAQAQKQNIKVRKGNPMIDMCKWLDIGHPYKQYSSPEVARKMNFITKTKFGSDTKMKKIIMERCSFKSSSKKEKHNDKRLCCKY